MGRSKISSYTVEQLLKQQNNKCNECKKILRDRENYHIDHIIPLGKGGTEGFDNLQILCIPCHLIKTQFDGFNPSFIKPRTKMVVCQECGKVIRGFNIKHAKYLLMQHDLKHRYEAKHRRQIEEENEKQEE